MTIVAIVLAGTLAGTLGLVAWLVYGRIGAADRSADARIAQIEVEGELERRLFELDATHKTLSAANKRAAALEEILEDAVKHAPDHGLVDGDVLGRLLRFAERWREASGGPLPAAAGEIVSDKPAPEHLGATLMHPDEVL